MERWLAIIGKRQPAKVEVIESASPETIEGLSPFFQLTKNAFIPAVLNIKKVGDTLLRLTTEVEHPWRRHPQNASKLYQDGAWDTINTLARQLGFDVYTVSLDNPDYHLTRMPKQLTIEKLVYELSHWLRHILSTRAEALIGTPPQQSVDPDPFGNGAAETFSRIYDSDPYFRGASYVTLRLLADSLGLLFLPESTKDFASLLTGVSRSNSKTSL